MFYSLRRFSYCLLLFVFSFPSFFVFSCVLFFVIFQLLANDFTFDSIDVNVKQTTYVPEVNYMTTWDNWLNVQVPLFCTALYLEI